MKSVLSEKALQDERAAYAWVEARVWPEGPICPHCGGVDRISKMGGKSTRIGTYKCYQCRKPFTVKVGTIFESSHVPMRHWLQAMFLLCSSKKGISSNQLARTLGCTLKTAWFISHRIREAMKALSIEPLGGEGKTVEADETYFGSTDTPRVSKQRRGRPYKRGHQTGLGTKRAVLALVERGGNVRSFHISHADSATVTNIVTNNIKRESRLHTDESKLYIKAGQKFAVHEKINHSVEEYVRGDVHTNTIEGYFSVFKRGMKGVYQHCGEKHLHRYLSEFDFRYNNRIALGINDVARTEQLVKGIMGRRLTYR